MLSVCGKSLKEPILGKNFRHPPRPAFQPKIALDGTMKYVREERILLQTHLKLLFHQIPIYVHFHLHPLIDIRRPRTPVPLTKKKHLKLIRNFVLK